MSALNISGIKEIRNYYFWSISCIYLFAFTSIYLQIPGLYGDDGVLPVRAFAQIEKRGANALVSAFSQLPSLVWLGPSVGLSLTSTLEIVALIGVMVSLIQLLFPSFRDFSMYSLQLVLYFSIYQVGQTFMHFQWDILLLEVGALTALSSTIRIPLLLEFGPHNALTFWLIRWLLFRLMFASGVVKLTSGCPKWWTLTALDIHFESQCIPTPISWFTHHFPKWFLKFSVISTYVIEIVVPFLFFIPIKNLRVFSFIMQVLFQLAIIATGNYNFFNLLTIALCFAILNDSHIQKSKSVSTQPKPRFLMPKILQKLITLFVYFSIIYWTIKLFDIKLISGSLSMNTAFNNDQLNHFILWAIPISISIATISLLCNILLAISRCLILPTNTAKRFANLLFTLIYSLLVIFMFAISLVPHVSVDPTHSVRLWPIINRWHKSVDGFHIANSYGLFRRMTGTDGRPELIIEGNNDLTSITGWKEYHFMYKPGDITKAPKFIIPHQPRLDWQMWFAALDNYQNNPWLLHLCYRLLTAQPEVLDLLDRKRLPFQKPPKYIRVRLYTYRFTGKNAKNWWRREEVSEYMPPVSKESLIEFLKGNGIETVKKVDLNDKYPAVTKTLKFVRHLSTKLSPTSFIYSLLSAVVLIASF